MRIPAPRRFLGLPLHPMLVHFPIAFWLCVPVLDALALFATPQPWWGLALGASAAGVAIGAMAVLTGLLEYVALSESDNNDVRLAARHGVRTTVVWCAFSAKLLAAGIWTAGPMLIALSLAVDLAACALLVQGGVFGTRITYGGYGR